MTDREKLLAKIERGEDVTAQEIFDVSVAGLRAQGRKALKSFVTELEEDELEGGCGLTHTDWTCAYRGDGGVMCAVGQLIPDSLYDPDWDCASGTNVKSLLDGNDGLRSLRQHEGLLESMQSAHDGTLEVGFDRELPRRMRDLALDVGLDPKVCDL